MWFKVATGEVSMTSSCPWRPSQAGFLIRAAGRGQAWLLLQGQGKPYLMSPGPLTLDPLSLSSTDLMGQNMSFRLKRCFLNLRVHLFVFFSLEKAHFKQPLTLLIHSLIHSVSINGLFYQVGCMILIKDQSSLKICAIFAKFYLPRK